LESRVFFLFYKLVVQEREDQNNDQDDPDEIVIVKTSAHLHGLLCDCLKQASEMATPLLFTEYERVSLFVWMLVYKTKNQAKKGSRPPLSKKLTKPLSFLYLFLT
jgi:hypothetical protein